MTSGRPQLQIVYTWKQLFIGYRLMAARDAVTVGPTPGDTFTAPGRNGRPKRCRVIAAARGGYRLRVWPEMAGRLNLAGDKRNIEDLFALPGPSRFLREPAPWRDVKLHEGDAGDVLIDRDAELVLRFRYVEAPPPIPRPTVRHTDPLLFRAAVATTLALVVLLTGVVLVGSNVQFPPPIDISAERYTKVVAPILHRQNPHLAEEERARAEAREHARKRKEREAEAKRAKEAAGRLGRKDAPNRDTVLPQGPTDVLREKVSKTGILAVIGTAKASGSGLGRLLTTEAASYDQALNGLAGATLVAGRGEGGLGTVGTGIGGGGTSFGRIQGSGDLNVGAGRGQGRRGPSLGTGREKEVSVGMETGSPDAEGGLSKDQIYRVVRAHYAALKYCYEKELQRQQLSGKIDLFWVINANGTVDRVKVASSTMGNRAVESCMERQVKQWQFPKSDAPTIVQSYPFLFKGGR